VPVQVSVYCVAMVMAEVTWVPLVGSEPDQPPEAVHAVAPVELQVRFEVWPLATEEGLALSDTVGAFAVTVTVTDWDAEPPAPVHVTVNFVFDVRVAVTLVPLVDNAPDQPLDAVHAVALVELQIRVDELPEVTVLGLAVSWTVGAAADTVTVVLCVTDPVALVQVSV